MKNWMKENWKYVLLFILIFCLAIPLLINCLFKMEAPFEFIAAEWQAADALAFYGAIIASLTAVYGVYLTIQYSQKNYQEDVRNRTLPFIVIDTLKTKSHMNLFKSGTKESDEEVEGYVEYRAMNYYCILKDGRIEYKTRLSKTEQQLLDNGGMRWESRPNGAAMVVVDDIMVPMDIENVGNGAAIRFRYGLNRQDTPEKEKKYLPAISLKMGQIIRFHIFSDDCGKESKNLGAYVLSFYYDDIYSNKYKQEFSITIEYSDEKAAPLVSIDMSHKQEFLGGRENG